MKLLGYLSVLLCAVVICHGQNMSDLTTEVPVAETTTVLPVTTQKPPTSPTEPATTEKPTVAPTETSHSTDAPPATTSSESPDTTSKPSNATTQSPDTTVEPHNGTVTSTEPPPTTVEPVTTTLPPASADLEFKINSSEVVCVYAKMELTIDLKYKTKAGTAQGTIELLTNNTFLNEEASTKCNMNETSELLVLTYNNWSSITFSFTKDKDSKVTVNNINLDLHNLTDIFADATEKDMKLFYNSSLFETTTSFSYKCDSEMSVQLLDGSVNATGSYLKFQKVQVQAFQDKSDVAFRTAKECPADDNVSDIVPIAVGCALAGLVVIVLIAYLVGRRQKRQRGYESV